MSNIFFIGDTHFGHKNILKFDGIKSFRKFDSIEEHDEELIKRWNSVVRERDTVWHLGDLAFSRKALDLCGRLKGIKKLVLGNHDLYPTKNYLKYFNKVYGAAAIEDMILTHVPVHPLQFQRFKANIHGHLHAYNIKEYYFPIVSWTEGMKETKDPRYINVSAEQINLTPIAIEDLRIIYGLK